MKTNGATWNAYMASYPDGQWFDDSDVTIDGEEIDGIDAPDDATVAFTCGVVYRCESATEGASLVQHFRRWQRRLTFEIVMCEVPKHKMAEFDELLKTVGATKVKEKAQ